MRKSLNILRFISTENVLAQRITGLYYREIALIHLQDQDHTVPEGYYRKAAESYEKAARTYPVDDEYHVCASFFSSPLYFHMSIPCTVHV